MYSPYDILGTVLSAKQREINSLNTQITKKLVSTIYFKMCKTGIHRVLWQFILMN